ncbi:MAG: biotin--[acetyl-CoA-carboxylase] ligase [Bdellovibrionales bacterium]|nr:biotin--[acetyl-CoA-carboxylase] ligase [Bdellovibrionales bacterium]
MSVLGELLESCASTNELAKEKGSLGPRHTPHGSWISARVQSAGRGRLGRTWKSTRGNLFLSIVLRPSKSQYWTWIPLLGAVEVLELLNSGKFGFWDSQRFSIKWPNDLWLDRKKLGGILCESVNSSQSGSFVVFGLGLNTAEAPVGLDQPTASLEDASLADRMRQPLADAISAAVLRLDREGPEFIRKAFEHWTAFPAGSLVSWKANGEKLQGMVQGLGSSGELEILIESGRKKSLYAEEISEVRSGS